MLEMSVADRATALQMFANIGIDVDLTRSPFTPGDEGFTPSCEGGEYETFEDLAQQVAEPHGLYMNIPGLIAKFNVSLQSRRGLKRTRHDRVEVQTEPYASSGPLLQSGIGLGGDGHPRTGKSSLSCEHWNTG